MEVLLKRWIAHEGERSLVAEVDARGVPGAQSDQCLIHETESTMRRLWRYPDDWNQLEDSKLIALFAAPLCEYKRAAPAAKGEPMVAVAAER